MEFNREFFDAGIYRVGMQSTKWDGIRKDCGKDDIVPLWVADMDFPSPARGCIAPLLARCRARHLRLYPENRQGHAGHGGLLGAPP